MCEVFYSCIEERVTKYSQFSDFTSISSCFQESKGVVLSTIHAVKGEEYTAVIAFGLLDGYLPNWSYFNDPKKHLKAQEAKKLLYVMASRTKKNLYLFSESGHFTKKGNLYTPTSELSTYKYTYD